MYVWKTGKQRFSRMDAGPCPAVGCLFRLECIPAVRALPIVKFMDGDALPGLAKEIIPKGGQRRIAEALQPVSPLATRCNRPHHLMGNPLRVLQRPMQI